MGNVVSFNYSHSNWSWYQQTCHSQVHVTMINMPLLHHVCVGIDSSWPHSAGKFTEFTAWAIISLPLHRTLQPSPLLLSSGPGSLQGDFHQGAPAVNDCSLKWGLYGELGNTLAISTPLLTCQSWSGEPYIGIKGRPSAVIGEIIKRFCSLGVERKNEGSICNDHMGYIWAGEYLR